MGLLCSTCYSSASKDIVTEKHFELKTHENSLIMSDPLATGGRKDNNSVDIQVSKVSVPYLSELENQKQELSSSDELDLKKFPTRVSQKTTIVDNRKESMDKKEEVSASKKHKLYKKQTTHFGATNFINILHKDIYEFYNFENKIGEGKENYVFFLIFL